MHTPKWVGHPVVVTFLAIAGAVGIYGVGYTVGQGSATAENSIETAEQSGAGDEIAGPSAEVEDTTPAEVEGPNSAEGGLEGETAGASSTDGPVPMTELQPFGEATFESAPTSGEMGLATYDEVVWCRTNDARSAWEDEDYPWLEFRVDRRFSTFRATVGFADDNEAGTSVTLRLTDEEGESIGLPATYMLGEVGDVEFDISSAIRVFLTCEGSDGQRLGFANAEFVPK